MSLYVTVLFGDEDDNEKWRWRKQISFRQNDDDDYVNYVNSAVIIDKTKN